MIDFFKDIFTSKANETSLILFVFAVIVSILVVIGFVKLVKFCFAVEKNSEKSAHTLIKTILVAFAPTIYSILSLFDNISIIPSNIIIIICVVMSVTVAIWNIMSFGIVCGILFTIMHIVFGLFASLGIGAFVFIAVAMVVLMLFGGSVGGSSVSSSSAPEYVRDPATGETVRVEKGYNGELYVGGTSTVLRQGDYAGEYIDSNGNRYIS